MSKKPKAAAAASVPHQTANTLLVGAGLNLDESSLAERQFAAALSRLFVQNDIPAESIESEAWTKFLSGLMAIAPHMTSEDIDCVCCPELVEKAVEKRKRSLKKLRI